YLIVEGRLTKTNDYRFRLLDLAQAPMLALNETNSDVLPGLNTTFFRFNGTNGQRLFFDSLTPNSASLGVIVIEPNNVELIVQNITTDFDFTPMQTGEHLLRLYSITTDDEPYNFRIVTPVITTNNLILGQVT